MLIAGPGKRGPFSVDDLRSALDAAPLDTAAPYAELRARACTHVLALAPDHNDRRTIEYIVWRLRDNDDAAVTLAHRLHNLIRTRRPGAFA